MKKIYSVKKDLALGIIIPLVCAIVIPLVFIVIFSDEPLNTLITFFTGPWSNAWFFGNTLDSMVLLLGSSLGALIAFRGGCFNLGCEGQIYLGGCAAAIVLLSKLQLPNPLMLLLAALAASAAGGIMGSVSGMLRKRLNANELITSFLLAAALIPVGDYLISSVLRGPGMNLLATDKFSSGRVLPKLLPPSSLSISLIIAAALVFLFYLLIHRTVWGYRFRISGAAPDLALFTGIDPAKRFTTAMTVSGALAGLAGFFAVAGTYGMCYQGFSGGLGWNGIALALIAGNEPLLLFPAALVFGAVKAGAAAVMLHAGFGFETASFIEAAVLLLAALPFGIRYLRGRNQ